MSDDLLIDVDAPAVDPVDTVIAFLNSIDAEEGTDEMTSLASWHAWIDAHPIYADLDASNDAALARARSLRQHLRDSCMGVVPDEDLHVPVTVSLPTGAPAGLVGHSVDGRVAAAVATLVIDGRWNRVKVCPADDCGWAFFDRSRNSSRQWCSMQVCGNRAKARNHRERASTG